jgi:hypothetical protein
MITEDIRTSEPYHDPNFLERATAESERMWSHLVSSQAAGGYTNLKGVWVPVEDGPIVECEEGDDGAVAWHDLVRKSCGAGVDSLLTTKYFKAAT